MKLTDHINKHYKGSVKAFADDNGIKHRQQIEKMVSRDNYHVIEVEGWLRLIQVKREIKAVS